MAQQSIAGSIIFRLKDTYGFPIEMSLAECTRKNVKIEWPSYVTEAVKHGWRSGQILKSVSECGSEYVKRMEMYLLGGRHG